MPKFKVRKWSLLLALVFVGLIISIMGIYLSFPIDSVNIDEIIERVEFNTADQVNHSKVKLNQIPKQCQLAFVAIEDQNFYAHIGIDASGIGRGLSGIITSQNLGGSTIHQQLIKNWTQNIYDRSLSAKVIETIYAMRLNFYFTKYQVLETYLNVIYMGRFNYGIAAAAEAYFGKPVEGLSLAECAYLAGLPQAPEVYNPDADLSAGLNRQQLVLNAMFRLRIINEQEYGDAKTEKLVFVTPGT